MIEIDCKRIDMTQQGCRVRKRLQTSKIQMDRQTVYNK